MSVNSPLSLKLENPFVSTNLFIKIENQGERELYSFPKKLENLCVSMNPTFFPLTIDYTKQPHYLYILKFSVSSNFKSSKLMWVLKMLLANNIFGIVNMFDQLPSDL